jgi:hypothetical protein
VSKRPARFKNLDKAFAGFSVVCARAARGQYLPALQQLGAMPENPPAADPVREALNDTLGAVVKCDHKFVDSKHCLKCGWTPPPVEDE